MPGKRVLSVGNCSADHAAVTRILQKHFGAEVVPADSASEAIGRLESEAFDLVLVNRVFDANGESGLDLIRQLLQEPPKANVPVMLISNYDWAQREATAVGARPGFGKASLAQPETLDRLRQVLG